MEKQLKTRGIILRKIDLGEADQIITVLSEDQGKVSLVAKGARRLKSRFLGKMELMTDILVTYFQGRELGRMNEIESHPLLDDSNLDLKSRSLLFYMAEATHKLVADDQECRRIYHHLKGSLRHFEKTHSEAIFYSYLVKLLTELGFMADWSQCNETNLKLDLNKPYFVSHHDGSLTSHSSLGIPVNPPIIKWVNFMQKEGFENLKAIKPTESEKNEVFSVLKSVLGGIINHPFKSEGFLRLV